jgi:ribonuclease D
MAYYTGDIAVDTETLGLIPRRDRLCVVQLSPGDGSADVIQIASGQKRAPNLVALAQRTGSCANCSTTGVSTLPCSTMPSA